MKMLIAFSEESVKFDIFSYSLILLVLCYFNDVDTKFVASLTGATVYVFSNFVWSSISKYRRSLKSQ